MATEQQCSDAVVAFLSSPTVPAYDLGDVPALIPARYNEVTVTRRFGGEQRSSGVRDGQMFRITVRQVAKVYQNAQNLRVTSARLEYAVLAVAGQSTTPIEFESADPIAPDDGYFSGLETWTFALI